MILIKIEGFLERDKSYMSKTRRRVSNPTCESLSQNGYGYCLNIVDDFIFFL